ncbi:hypothetical protein [Prosthecobacter sp.]|uniref:hypothetical protein n=1 Tax=Prosthecobacter sp. TaxID=1965333 RepID=UPI0037831F44
MSLEALKELSALDGEVKRLLHRYEELLLDRRRRYLAQIVECFAGLTEAEGFRIKRDPMGVSARLSDTELAISGTDPSHILVEAQAKYIITCSLAANRAYGILLFRQPLQEFTNQSSDTNDQITNKKLEIDYLKSMIENQGNDQWYVIGRMETMGDNLAMVGVQPQYESFSTFDQAVKTALREISQAAIAPRAP